MWACGRGNARSKWPRRAHRRAPRVAAPRALAHLGEQHRALTTPNCMVRCWRRHHQAALQAGGRGKRHSATGRNDGTVHRQVGCGMLIIGKGMHHARPLSNAHRSCHGGVRSAKRRPDAWTAVLTGAVCRRRIPTRCRPRPACPQGGRGACNTRAAPREVAPNHLLDSRRPQHRAIAEPAAPSTQRTLSVPPG